MKEARDQRWIRDEMMEAEAGVNIEKGTLSQGI